MMIGGAYRNFVSKNLLSVHPRLTQILLSVQDW